MTRPKTHAIQACILIATRIKIKTRRLSQQPALGALTFLRSFVAGKANFCSHLLESLVHFTAVKSQAILTIRLGVAEVISAVTLYLLPASKRRNFCLVGYVQAQQFCVWTLLIDRHFDSNDVLYNVSRGGELTKRKKPKNINIQPFLINIFQLHSNAVRIYDYAWCNKILTLVPRLNPSLGFVTEQSSGNSEHQNKNKKRRRNLDSGAFRPRVKDPVSNPQLSSLRAQ